MTLNGEAAALEVSGLSKQFGRRKALRSCSFVLPQGSSLVIFGPNGAGKTTLLRMLATLDKPSKGSFKLLGLDSKKQADEVRARIGLISHAPMLYPDLSAEENLLFYAKLYGVEDPQKRVANLLEFVELSSRRNDAVRGFSRGMMQRVCLARALVNDPDIVFLDEPYSGLDPHASRIVDELFAKRGNIGDAGLPSDGVPGKTLVSVSHAVERSYKHATHVLLLSRGKQVMFEPVENVSYEELSRAFAEVAGEGSLA